jgi:hypothetical protein
VENFPLKQLLAAMSSGFPELLSIPPGLLRRYSEAIEESRA